MAKKSTSPAPVESQSGRRLVGIDPELARKIGVIASALGISVPDYVNLRLQATVDHELPEVMRQFGFAPHKE